MTDQQRPPGYRGALPPRGDRMARPWIAAVLGIFVLIFLLALANVPSRFIPTATPTPLPSVAASETPAASESAAASAAASASASDPVPTTYYIAPGGSDVTGDGTSASPWETLGYASTRLGPGDTLRMKAGTYTRENGTDWVAAGTASQPINVVADTTQVTFDGGHTFEQWMFFGDGAAYTNISGLTLTNYHPVRNGIVIVYQSANHLSFDIDADAGNGGSYSLDNKSNGSYLEHVFYLSQSDVDSIDITGTLDATNLSGASIHIHNDPGPTNINLHDLTLTGGHWGIVVDSSGVTGTITNCTSTGADVAWQVTSNGEIADGVTWSGNSPSYP